MEIRRWSLESYDQLRERIVGAVQQKQLLVEAAKKEIQDEDKKKKFVVAPVESLVVEYFDGEHWIVLASKEEFLEALRVMKQQNQELLTLRVGPSKIWKKCHGMGAGGHRKRWWRRAAEGALDAADQDENPAAAATPEPQSDDSADESTDEKDTSADKLPEGAFMRRRMWRGRRHHHGKFGKKHLEEADDAPEAPFRCRGRRWRKWLKAQEEAKEQNQKQETIAPDAPVDKQEKQEPVAPAAESIAPDAPPAYSISGVLDTQYADVHAALIAMGFTNTKLNEHLLVHHSGNVTSVVTALIKLQTG